MNVDQYAQDCHQLITVEKQVSVDCQSDLERMSTRVVELLGQVAELEDAKRAVRAAGFEDRGMTGMIGDDIRCMDAARRGASDRASANVSVEGGQ